MTATDGTKYVLSQLRGKYVFIDCWATWCGPCVGEIPNVKALHAATKGRDDFVLLGVSLDRDKKALDDGLKRHGIEWPQVFGSDSGAEEVFEALEGTGIPYTCLIGPDGKMIAQHLRGQGLKDAVLKHLPKKP
jgi:thiol-disulfide isomerase/thioredoxin